MSETDTTKKSGLSQVVKRDGKSIHVEIYASDDGWVLEAVDKSGNSTIWDGVFGDDQEALEVLMRAIDEEGIDTMIGTLEERAQYC